MRTTKRDLEEARKYAAYNTSRFNLSGMCDDIDELELLVQRHAEIILKAKFLFEDSCWESDLLEQWIKDLAALGEE